MIYRAYANGKEINNFYIGGKETSQIWGGDTLLWEKKSGGIVKELFKISSRFTGYDSDKNPYTCQYDIALMSLSESEKDAIISLGKVGVVMKNSSSSTPPWHTYTVRAYLLFGATIKSPQINQAKLFKQAWRQWDKKGNLTYSNESYTYIGVGKDNYDGYYSYISGFGSEEEGLNAFLVESNFPNLEASSGTYLKDVSVVGCKTFSTVKEMVEYVSGK